MLPVLTYTAPDAAADALRWRHCTLPAGHRAGRPARPAGRGVPVADDRGPGVLGLLAGRHRRLPRQRRHRRRGDPLRRRHRRRGVRPGPGDGAAGPDRPAVALPRPPRRPGPVPHRRRHRAGRVQRRRRQQRLHQPDGPAEPAGRGGGGRAGTRTAPASSASTRRSGRLAGRGAGDVHPLRRGARRAPPGRGVHPARGLGLRRHPAGPVPAAAALPLLRPVPQAGRQAGRPGAGHAPVPRRVHRRAEGRATSTTTSRSPSGTPRCRPAPRR